MTLYLDLETTGLSEDDEILEIGMLDDDGSVVLNILVRPIHHTDWPEAQAIHGIGPDTVEDAPTLDELREDIVALVSGREIVIYNADYDAQYLRAELSAAASVSCCMLAYAEFRDEWSEYWDNYRRHKLTDAAAAVLHEWQGDAHRALADCRAVRAVWRYLNDPDERQRIDALKAERKAEADAEFELLWLQNQEKARQEKFQRDMDEKWMLRWGYPTKRLHFQERNARELEYYRVFTGMEKAIWNQYRYYKAKISMIESLPDAPKYCMGQKDVDALAPHLQQRMQPRLFYLSKSRKSFRLFYDRRELTKLRRRFRRRKYQVYESYDDVPPGLMSKSQWKERGVNVEKEGIEPVAEYFFSCRHGNRYVLLYRIPAKEEERP